MHENSHNKIINAMSSESNIGLCFNVLFYKMEILKVKLKGYNLRESILGNTLLEFYIMK